MSDTEHCCHLSQGELVELLKASFDDGAEAFAGTALSTLPLCETCRNLLRAWLEHRTTLGRPTAEEVWSVILQQAKGTNDA